MYDGKKKKKPTHLNQVESEILCYNSEDCIDIDEDPLLWWKKRESQYPLMVKLVRKYFSIPATSVRSEEIFSTAGNVLTGKRNRLLPENVNRLVFLHENLGVTP